MVAHRISTTICKQTAANSDEGDEDVCHSEDCYDPVKGSDASESFAEKAVKLLREDRTRELSLRVVNSSES